MVPKHLYTRASLLKIINEWIETFLSWNDNVMSCHRLYLPHPFPWGRGVLLLEPIPTVSGWGQGTPWRSRQLIAGPHWRAMWGSLSCSRTPRLAAQPSPELGFEPVTFWSLANLLYPLKISDLLKSVFKLNFMTLKTHLNKICRGFKWTSRYSYCAYAFYKTEQPGSDETTGAV